LAVGLGLVTACSPAPVETVHGVTPGHACQAERAQSFVGQPAGKESGEGILRASNAKVLRWALPGVMLTMDFRNDRVTVRTGSDGKITAISCG
jgi:hypothetical protein